MPCLTELLDCHINVDVCFTTNVFMYLYKYLFKGPDRTIFTVSGSDRDGDEQPTDELKDYIRGRYLSASEAAWRILKYNRAKATFVNKGTSPACRGALTSECLS